MNMCLRCGDKLVFGMVCLCTPREERVTVDGLVGRISALEAEVRELKARRTPPPEREPMYGPILGGNCRLCFQPNHSPMTCEQWKAHSEEMVERFVKSITKSPGGGS